MTVEITRLDLSAAELRDAATRTRDAKAARRMLAMALVLEGRSRDEVARSCGMDRQTLRDWAHRYKRADWAACSTCRVATARGRGFRPSSGRRWPSGLRKAPTSRETA